MNHTLSLALKSTYLLGFAVLGFNLHKCIMDSWLQLLTHYLFIRFIPISLPIFQQFIFYFQVLAGILANRAQSLPPPSVILKDRRRLQKREEEVKGRRKGLSSAGRSPQFATCVLGGRETTASEAAFFPRRVVALVLVTRSRGPILCLFGDRAEMGTDDADDYFGCRLKLHL